MNQKHAKGRIPGYMGSCKGGVSGGDAGARTAEPGFYRFNKEGERRPQGCYYEKVEMEAEDKG